MYKIKFILLLAFLGAAGQFFAQDKLEKESRIKRKEVPAAALQFMDSLNLKTKVKWFLEEGLNQSSIEAKFRQNRIRYSIEFDSSGRIEDVEIEVKWENLPSALKDTISSQLALNCISYKVRKVQKQFTGSARDLFLVLKSGQAQAALILSYEMIVKCKGQKSVDLFEYLFSSTGRVQSISKIVFKNSSHLEY